MKYAKCLVEVDEILNYLKYDELIKIPEEVRELIKNNKDKNYTWTYDITKGLNEQNINRETVAILSYLNMKYLLDEKQRAVMEEIHISNEKKKRKNVIILSDNKEADKRVADKTQLINVSATKWYKKLGDFFKNIFQKG
jgi:hypothetical protein